MEKGTLEMQSEILPSNLAADSYQLVTSDKRLTSLSLDFLIYKIEAITILASTYNF